VEFSYSVLWVAALVCLVFEVKVSRANSQSARRPAGHAHKNLFPNSQCVARQEKKKDKWQIQKDTSDGNWDGLRYLHSIQGELLHIALAKVLVPANMTSVI
jgi:hypothetical protein